MTRASPALVLRLASLVAFVALAASLAYALGALGARPLDGVEGEVLFEADRLRAGLALYTDPQVGAHDYGPVPARFYVLYPPVWAYVVSFLPGRSAHLVARLLTATAWFGLLASIAARAPREHRRLAWIAAAFVGGVYTLTLYGAAARPDAIAVALSGAALVRSVERGRVEPLAGALFALAAWTKPNVLGLAAGALLVQLLLDRRTAARAIAAALGTSAVIAGLLQFASGGAWLDHLARATGQPASLALWLEQVPSRAQFFLAPLLVAGWAAWRARAEGAAARLALGALVASSSWTLLSLAKIGSATNYWMEPMVAALVAVARFGVPLPREGAVGWAVAGGSLLQALWTGIATVRSSLEALPEVRARAAFVARARATCGAGVDELVAADEPGLEQMLDGRVLTTPFQMTHLARRGRYPLGPWLLDLAAPEVRCLLMQDGLLERPLSEVSVEHDRFGPELRAALRDRFGFVEEQAGLRLYRARY